MKYGLTHMKCTCDSPYKKVRASSPVCVRRSVDMSATCYQAGDVEVLLTWPIIQSWWAQFVSSLEAPGCPPLHHPFQVNLSKKSWIELRMFRYISGSVEKGRVADLLLNNMEVYILDLITFLALYYTYWMRGSCAVINFLNWSGLQNL